MRSFISTTPYDEAFDTLKKNIGNVVIPDKFKKKITIEMNSEQVSLEISYWGKTEIVFTFSKFLSKLKLRCTKYQVASTHKSHEDTFTKLVLAEIKRSGFREI